MKKLLILFFILFFSTSQLFSSEKNINYYEKLLTNLQSNKGNNLNINLQKSLIYKIINLLKNKPQIKNIFEVQKINSQDEFVEKFFQLVEIYSDYLKGEDLLDENSKKLNILKLDLNKLDNSSPDFLSFQLQYDFYNFSQKILIEKNEIIRDNYLKWLKNLLNQLQYIDFKKENLDNQIQNLFKLIAKNKLKIEELKIDKERLTILGKNISLLTKTINYYENKNIKILKNILKFYSHSFFKELKFSSKKTFKIKAKIESFLNKYFIEDKYFYSAFSYSIDKITELKIGKQNILIHDTKKTIYHTISYIISILKKPIFSINHKGISIIDIIIAIFVFIIGIYIGLIYKKYINQISYKSINLTESTKVLISNLGYYVIITISFFITLKIIGLDLSSLTLIVGALSVGIGFGLQSIISNFICGLILMFEKSIKIGDFIEISEDLIGTVLSINMRATIIKTNDNIEIIIPNQTLFQNNVINWTLTDDIRRLRIPFGVAYGTDIEKVKSAVLTELFASDLEFIRKNEDKKPNIIMTNMDSSSVNFELVVWVKGKKTKFPRNTKSDFLILIYNALYKHNIEIPFPQLDVHLREFKDELKVKKIDKIT